MGKEMYFVIQVVAGKTVVLSDLFEDKKEADREFDNLFPRSGLYIAKTIYG